MRLQSEDKDDLRQLVRQWIVEKEAAKGKSLARVRVPKKQKDQRQERGDL